MSFPTFPSGQPAAGTLLKRGVANSPESFVTVGNVMNINGPQSTRASVKTTSHSTVPAGGGPVFDTFVPTTIDPGKIAFDLAVKTDSAAHRQLMSDFVQGTLVDWQIVHPDQLATVFQFSAFFTSFKITSNVNDITRVACELQASGVMGYGF